MATSLLVGRQLAGGRQPSHITTHPLLSHARYNFYSAAANVAEKVVDLTQRITQALSKEPPELENAKDMAVELKYWVGLEHAAKERL